MQMYRQPMESTSLIEDLRKAINGEYSAIQCYEKLAKNAPTKAEREQILEIRQDEINHFQTFSQIYVSLTGQQPKPEITEECPDDYRKGVRASFVDEQETTDFYLDIADKARTPYIRHVFKRASADEQNHAVWFLSFLTLRG
ncbi:ferritin-like domain-containing protein [Pseudalkalibacillus sp. R45]|uniref:ferritin-like domain-containing protein n=1 Tax=Pseudalkalibacillus sp. R45 TaxID=3457433 RepID=UPI003FCC5E7D